MDIIKKIYEKQDWLEDKARGIGKGKYARVLKMAVKPTNEEFAKSLLVTGIGIMLVGAIGFAVFLLWEYVPKLVKWML
jgi:protein transport protein SEC61 subunit gamma and related proteins